MTCNNRYCDKCTLESSSHCKLKRCCPNLCPINAYFRKLIVGHVILPINLRGPKDILNKK